MDESTNKNDAKPPGRVGRPKGRLNRLSIDIRETIQQAFHKAGGRDYLVKVAHQRPDVFLSLVGRIIPQETRLSVMASYQAMPIPVEQRESGPLPPPGLPVAPMPVLDDDWLTVSPDPAHIASESGMTTAYGPMVNDTSAIEGEWDAVPVAGAVAVDRGTG